MPLSSRQSPVGARTGMLGPSALPRALSLKQICRIDIPDEGLALQVCLRLVCMGKRLAPC